MHTLAQLWTCNPRETTKHTETAQRRKRQPGHGAVGSPGDPTTRQKLPRFETGQILPPLLSMDFTKEDGSPEVLPASCCARRTGEEDILAVVSRGYALITLRSAGALVMSF